MKKRLLFMLTMMVIMCAICFSASAVDCNNLSPAISHTYRVTQVVKATCEYDGYKVYTCANGSCTSSYKVYTDTALGHDWKEELVFEGQCSCSCPAPLVEKKDGTLVCKYKNEGKTGCDCTEAIYYYKSQTCERKDCGAVEYERIDPKNDKSAPAKYFKVEFLNGQAFDKRDEYVTVTSYGKTYEIPVKYTVLAEVPVYDATTKTYTGTKTEALQTSYVKEGETATYVSKKPIRTKDMRYGEFRFIGWMLNKNLDLATTADIIKDSDKNYKITTEAVHANAKYYAAWEGVNVTYKTIVYNSDGQQLLIAQNVKHGDSIDYPFSYPTRESETSVDYTFAGWEIGTKTAAGDKYDFYPVNEAHIKDIPIFSGDAIKAAHSTTARKYRIEFCDAQWNKQGVVDVAYNSDVTNKMEGIEYGNYSDETYLYEYKGYWETEKGQKVYLENFTVPKGSIDYNDPIYLKDDKGNYFLTTGGDKLEVEELHSYYYNNAGYFNKDVITYVFPVNEKGDYIVNSSGNAVCILVYDKGIQQIDLNGNRTSFSEADARNLRNIKVKPAYVQRVRKYKATIVTNIPSTELVPEDYKSGLIVQVTNENGQLLASGITKNNKCEIVVPKAEMYNITVVSPNEKYYAEKGIVWSIFKDMYDKTDIIMDLSLNKDYSEEHQSRCRCICHNTFFRGVWVRVLNILYSLFKVKYVCCYDMYATIGDLLAYTK